MKTLQRICGKRYSTGHDKNKTRNMIDLDAPEKGAECGLYTQTE